MKILQKECNWKHILFIALTQLKHLLIYPNNMLIMLYGKIVLRYKGKSHQSNSRNMPFFFFFLPFKINITPPQYIEFLFLRSLYLSLKSFGMWSNSCRLFAVPPNWYACSIALGFMGKWHWGSLCIFTSWYSFLRPDEGCESLSLSLPTCIEREPLTRNLN